MRSIQLAVLAAAAVALASGCDTARPVATATSTAAERCSACHGFPPPPYVTNAAATHPASTSCYLCHGTTVDANNDILPGGTHMDGRVEVTSHPLPFVAQHTAPALADPNVCKTCHGADFSGGQSGVSCTSCHAGLGFSDWQTNCTFCHGSRTPGWTLSSTSLPLAAPPRGAHGETLSSQPQVGAHQKHVGNGSTISDGVDCAECHSVPTDLSHLDGVAPLAFGPLATQGSLQPAYAGGSCSATYCHGTTLVGGANPTPTWTSTVACGDCHGSPPSTGRHLVGFHVTRDCSACHALVATSTGTPGIQNTPAAKALHVNGVKDVNLIVDGTWDPVAKSCSNVACHTQAPSTRYW